MRSVGCQYSSSEEQDHCSHVSAIEYSHVTTRLDVSSFLSDVATSVSSVSIAESEADSEFTVDASTEDSDDLDFDVGNIEGQDRVRGQGHRRANRNVADDTALTPRDIFRSTNRSIMAIIWCGYTLSMMLITNGFFPYIALYSLLFSLIMYADTLERRR